MSTPAKPAKASQMSSRLATMKFMQRAAASSPIATPDQPEPSSKRRRTGDHSYVSDPNSDLRAIQEALAAEELKRTQALERQATEAGDTKWILDIDTAPACQGRASFDIMNAGYSAIDTPLRVQDDFDVRSGNFDLMTSQIPGRKSFGNFGKTAEKVHQTRDDSGVDGSSSEDSSGGEEEIESRADANNRKIAGQASDEARAKRKAREKAQKAEATQLADRRRSKGVKLNMLSSISSGGGLKTKNSPSNSNITCFACGKQGHGKKECPNRRDSGTRT